MPRTTHMSAAGKSIFEGLQDALAYAQGDTRRGRSHTVRIPDTVDVKAMPLAAKKPKPAPKPKSRKKRWGK